MLIDPGRHVLFEYTRNHTNDAVDSLLAGYEGYLVADAHVVYDHLYERGDIVEVNCWAHSRRYFFKAMASDPERAGRAYACRGCCSRSSAASGRARKKREAIRQKHSRLSSNASSPGAMPSGSAPSRTPRCTPRCATPGTSAWACSVSSPTAACRSRTTSASASSAGRPWAARTGSSSAATTPLT
ncbi:MAG: transposase [Sandaracinaceae bacterium]|nr:transposase [Sandaracinaceae bacterium]